MSIELDEQRKVRMTPEQERDVETALLAYWTSRDEAAAAQLARGAKDVGGRQHVTSGGHLDRVAQLIARICIAAGDVARKQVERLQCICGIRDRTVVAAA
jgi:hypothetical protein